MTPAGRLRVLATELAQSVSSGEPPELAAIVATVEEVARSWSGSNLAEHATFYFHNLAPPPAEASFAAFLRGRMPPIPVGKYVGIGYQTWTSEPRARVRDYVLRRSNAMAFAATRSRADEVRRFTEDAQWEVASILSAGQDSHVAALRDAVAAISMPTAADLIAQHLKARERALATDLALAGRALRTAPHEDLLFEVKEVRAVRRATDDLSRLARRAADHLDRHPAARTAGTHVFIGHGRSPLWRELKDFLVDRLALPYEEFNRVPMAGTTTVDRLAEMLDNAAVALLLLTAEDERADGTVVARQNVIHEAGLFQGRLGFRRAVLLIEDGCESFSNVAGLSVIPFPRGDLSPAFEPIRLFLAREGLTT